MRDRYRSDTEMALGKLAERERERDDARDALDAAAGQLEHAGRVVAQVERERDEALAAYHAMEGLADTFKRDLDEARDELERLRKVSVANLSRAEAAEAALAEAEKRVVAAESAYDNQRTNERLERSRAEAAEARVAELEGERARLRDFVATQGNETILAFMGAWAAGGPVSVPEPLTAEEAEAVCKVIMGTNEPTDDRLVDSAFSKLHAASLSPTGGG